LHACCVTSKSWNPIVILFCQTLGGMQTLRLACYNFKSFKYGVNISGHLLCIPATPFTPHPHPFPCPNNKSKEGNRGGGGEGEERTWTVQVAIGFLLAQFYNSHPFPL